MTAGLTALIIGAITAPLAACVALWAGVVTHRDRWYLIGFGLCALGFANGLAALLMIGGAA